MIVLEITVAIMTVFSLNLCNVVLLTIQGLLIFESFNATRVFSKHYSL